ncbi:MAG: 4-hydroxy-tetrahydrodipicolinate synthase [Acidimicrobiales bacterium]
MGRFGSVLTAMISPFGEDGSVDLDEAAKLARWLVEEGNEGLIVTGTTGEGPTLTDAETRDIWRAVSEAVTVPVVAGVGTYDTRDTIIRSKWAKEAGADALLVVTPYYSKPSQAGLYAHFSAVASSTDLPIVLYDIPPRTARKIDTATMLRLANDHKNVLAVKDAAGNPAESARLVASAPSDFELYSGDDKLTLAHLAIGAVGCVGVATHWCATETAQMLAAFRGGDPVKAAALNATMIESYDFESSDESPNPIPSKVMLNTLGFSVGECRLPHTPPPEGLAETARGVYRRLKGAE